MAMNKCMACGCMRDDNSGTCPGCIASGMREAAAARTPNIPPSTRRESARGPGHRPANRQEADEILKATCLAWEVAEFGASLNHEARMAGAGKMVDILSIRGFATGSIRGNIDGMLERDGVNGYGPSEGSEWTGAYSQHSRVTPRRARVMDGERLAMFLRSIDSLNERVCIPGDVMLAARAARGAIEEWPRLIPWAFDMCVGGHRRADCDCPRCECCGDLGGTRCRRCFCDCGSAHMWRFRIAGQIHRRANDHGRCDTSCGGSDLSESGGVLLCPECDCFECAGRGRMVGAGGIRCAECDDAAADDALECPACRTPNTLFRLGGTLTCGACWLETTTEQAWPSA